MKVDELRTALWHFRVGGFDQVREWQRRNALDGGASRRGRRLRAHADEGVQLADLIPREPSPRNGRFADVRVASIFDEFSALAWGGEFDLWAVTPSDWHERFTAAADDGHPIDLLFVESAWNGNGGAWKYQLTGSKAPSDALRDLVAHCREQGIPTVFWNKEDPPHFDDFLGTARLFDVVFTSDERLVDRYREELGHDRVAPLAFAAAPAIHNPIRDAATHQLGDIAFAGMYFAHKFPERREQMVLLLGAANRLATTRGFGFDIYSRFEGGDKRYQFPGELADRVVGSVPYDRMLTAYGAYKVFLNVNSVVDSPSMCARRVFEISAAGTPVVSTRSVAIPEFFPSDEVAVVDDGDEAERVLRALVRSPQLRDRMVHRAQRRIWRHHTYANRAAEVLTAAGIAGGERMQQTPNVTVMVSTNRPHQLDHVLGQVARQRGVEVQLVLLTHGFEVPDARGWVARARALGISDVQTLSGDASWSLGACLNRLVEAADGEVLAKFDDDDLYGERYLEDALFALDYSGADLVGKQAAHLYLGSLGATVLRNPDREHRWTTFVAGPTLVAPKRTFVSTPFDDVTRGEDTALLRALGDADARVYSADRWNFVQVRQVRASDPSLRVHTWDVADEEILANGDVVAFGMAEGHVMR